MATEPRRWTLRERFARLEGTLEPTITGSRMAPGEVIEVVPRSELDRVEAERDLALKALGHGDYEAAQQYLMSALSGPASAGWADSQ